MATSQDGPLLVGAQNENTNSIKPLKVNNAGELLVTGGGSGGGDVNLIEVGGAAIALGQAAMAASLPVVIASNQTAVPVSGTVTATNPSVGSTGAAVPASATYVGLNVGGNLTGAASGSGTAAAALRVELPTNGTGVIATVAAVTAITNPVTVAQATAASLNATVVQGTATNLKAQAEAYQGGSAVGAANPLQVSLANTGANATPVAVSLATAPTTSVTQGTSPWIVAGGGTAGVSGTAVLTVQGIASGTAVPVSAASLPLPSGAASEATLAGVLTSTNFAAAFGTAGTADTQVMSVQGIASMTPVQVSQATASNLNVTVASKTIYQRTVYGTAQTVFNSSTDIAAGAFSAAGTDFTNNDATIGACLYADAMIEMPDWAAAPVAGTVVQLWGLLINVDGTDDDTDAPSAAASGGARLLGSWVIAAADALQRRTITISLAGIASGFTPYVFNGTAQNMNNDGGTNMVVKITPWTVAQVG